MPDAECTCTWERWWSGTKVVVTMSAVVLANLSIGAAMLWLQFSGDSSNGLRRSTAALALFNSVVIAAATASYIFVGTRGKLSAELNLHGLALLLMLVANTAYLAAEVLRRDQDTCTSSAVALILNFGFWGSFKALFFLLMKRKMMALGPPISCCVQAQLWGRALIVSVMMAITGGISAYATGVALLLRGYSCQEVRSVASLDTVEVDVPAAAKVTILISTFLALAGIASMHIAGFAMMHSAYRLAHNALSKLRKRGVPPEELAKVQRTLSHHVLGLFISIISTLLVSSLSAFVDGADLLGEGTENLVGGLVVTIDTAGDVTAILLLSGIGTLLVREDPEAGDIGGHLRSLLHAAVLTSRADVVFEGRVARTPSGVCVASFPGKFLAEWRALTWACEQGDLSSACVFLPTSDPKGRFGQHVVLNIETNDKCWCHSLHGETKPWGCAWFQEWKDNIERAVELGLELVVVFFPGQSGRGTVHWENLKLGSVNLWDGVGLGGSQKAEVAYLKMRGFKVTEVDLEIFRHWGWGTSSRRLPPLPTAAATV